MKYKKLPPKTQPVLVSIMFFLIYVGLTTTVGATGIGSIKDLFGAGGGDVISDPGDIAGIIKTIFEVAFSAAGVAAMAMIVVGGFNYIFSEGDPQKVVTAQKTIINGVIGLIIVILSVLIFNFVTERLLKVDAGVFDFPF